MNTEHGPIGNASRDEREALAQKLTEVLQENKLLHDRLAELDISMNIETVDLKKDIETLARERDELTKENEFLLEDYTAKDHRIHELLRQLEIKQLMITETSSYLSTATDRIKNLERQCSSLEAQYAGIYGNRTASEIIDEGAVPDDGPGQRTTLIEDIKKDFEETLGQKELEIETLHRNMEKLKEQNKFLAEEKAEIEKEKTDTAETPGPLENTLLEMEHSLVGLEQRISRASEIGVTEKEEILMKLDDAQREIFSLREYHRSLLEALRKTDEEARKDVFSLGDYHQSILETLSAKEKENQILKTEMAYMLASLREKDDTISGLRDETEQDSSSASIQEFEEKLDNAENRIGHLESALTQERMIRSDLEDTMQRKDMILQELHEHFVSDTAQLQTETARALEAAGHAATEVRRLETTVADSEEKVAELNKQIAQQKIFAEAKEREAAELAEQNNRIEEDRRLLIRTAEEEKSGLRDSISLRDRELEALARGKEELETELGNTAAELTRQKDLLAAREKTPASHEETEKLRRSNEELSARLAEAVQRAAALGELKTVVSLEIKSLSEKIELLKNEGIADRAVLKSDIDNSFSRIAESNERLNQAITEGLPLARKLEEISSAMEGGTLPAVYRAVPQDPEKHGGSPRARQIAVFSGLLLLLLIAVIFSRQDGYRALSEKGLVVADQKPAVWETGTKQAKSGQYEATLTFLNKEAVQVLGFSDIIPDAGLAHNTFALIEIRNSGGCIPEDFVASPEKNISFLDDHGAATPLNHPGAWSDWKKTVYKQNACSNRKTGAIYMKHIISAVKKSSLRGLAVRGLVKDPIIIQ